MSRRPTIKDVAERAGVSKSTVSLVLRGSPLVAPATAIAVRQAMDAIGYVYNRPAAQLRAGGRELIGLVINDLRNPFFTEFAASAQMALARAGHATVIANTAEDPAIQAEVIASMIEHGVSALVISPAYGGAPRPLEPTVRAGTPVIQVLRRIEESDRFPFAAPDYPRGGALATLHLLETGRRRIAFVGGLADRPVTVERMNGYLDALARAGREPIVFAGAPSRAFGREAALRIADGEAEIDGAVCFSDLVALGMIAGFAEAGVRLGVDFGLVGFDDIEEASLSYPQLSSVRCDVRRFGETIAGSVVRWLDEGVAPPAVARTPVELIVRASSANGDPPPPPRGSPQSSRLAS